MKYNFLQNQIEKKDIIKSQSTINPFLLENNINQIEQILNFLQQNKPLMLVSGFLGTGKDAIVKECTHHTSSDVIILEYTCFETTILDDVLLKFFETFKKLIEMHVIKSPKAKSENFTQKINSYFKEIEKPILIVINSFQDVLKENKPELLSFIKFISKLEKVKIIITSRKFNLEDFEAEIPYEKVSILGFSKPIFEKYLRHNNIKLIGPISDELYKHTRGYFLYLTLTTNIMKLRNIDLVEFLSGHTKSLLSYNDFILREALSLVDPVNGHLLRFLTMVRHPISFKLLGTLHLLDDEKIDFFIENMIFTKNNNCLFLKDYYKDISNNTITEHVALKLHRGSNDLYETQLPLKPFERDILISRQTMRKEIEYHTAFLPKKYVSKVALPPQVAIQTKIDKQAEINNVQIKEEKLKDLSFVFASAEEETNFMSDIVSSISDFVEENTLNMDETINYKNKPLIELMNLAKSKEENYDYKGAISIYNISLQQENDENFYKFLPIIHTKIAEAYKQQNQWVNALKSFELAYDFYKASKNDAKLADVIYEIATVYYMTFKKDNTKKLVEVVDKNTFASSSTLIKTYMLYSNIAETQEEKVTSYNYLQKAITLIDSTTDKEIKSELLFKYALSLDEDEQFEQAVQYYKECIKLDNNPKINPYLSSALTNIANIFEEHNKIDVAKKYYKESLKIDFSTNNYGGIYNVAQCLARIFENQNKPKSMLKYLQLAKASAHETKDIFYMATADLALGDYYQKRKDYERAIKYFLVTYNVAKKTFSKDNVNKIEIRIKELRIILGETLYNKIKRELADV
ncbi:MAG: hypothetical protein R3Y28_04745 [Candidatus Gastranaerophilales bacterium]